MSIYREKYLKYKNKYLQLLNQSQSGGSSAPVEDKIVNIGQIQRMEKMFYIFSGGRKYITLSSLQNFIMNNTDKISLEEFTANIDKHFGFIFDFFTGTDGTITKDSVQAILKVLFIRYPSIDMYDFNAYMQTKPNVNCNNNYLLFKLIDSNNDKRISQDEVQIYVDNLFALYDPTKTGSLTKEQTMINSKTRMESIFKVFSGNTDFITHLSIKSVFESATASYKLGGVEGIMGFEAFTQLFSAVNTPLALIERTKENTEIAKLNRIEKLFKIFSNGRKYISVSGLKKFLLPNKTSITKDEFYVMMKTKFKFIFKFFTNYDTKSISMSEILAISEDLFGVLTSIDIYDFNNYFETNSSQFTSCNDSLLLFKLIDVNNDTRISKNEFIHYAQKLIFIADNDKDKTVSEEEFVKTSTIGMDKFFNLFSKGTETITPTSIEAVFNTAYVPNKTVIGLIGLDGFKKMMASLNL